MNKNSDITFLLTVYEYNKIEMKRWFYYFKKLKKHGIDMHFLIDNVKIAEKFGHIPKDCLFVNDENYGKFLTVYRHLKNKNVKTKYIKVCDPDDFINIKKIINSKYPDKECIIATKFAFSKSIKLLNFISSSNNLVNLHFSKKIHEHPGSFPNSSTILPTKGIQDDNFYKDNETFKLISDDHLLGTICFCNGFPIKKYNDSWYYYRLDFGETNLRSLPRRLAMEVNAIDSWISVTSASKMIPDTPWPNWVLNSYEYWIKDYQKKYGNFPSEVKFSMDKIKEKVKKYENEAIK